MRAGSTRGCPRYAFYRLWLSHMAEGAGRSARAAGLRPRVRRRAPPWSRGTRSRSASGVPPCALASDHGGFGAGMRGARGTCSGAASATAAPLAPGRSGPPIGRRCPAPRVCRAREAPRRGMQRGDTRRGVTGSGDPDARAVVRLQAEDRELAQWRHRRSDHPRACDRPPGGDHGAVMTAATLSDVFGFGQSLTSAIVGRRTQRVTHWPVLPGC